MPLVDLGNLNKKPNITIEQKVDMLIGFVFGDSKAKGIVQILEGVWKKNEAGQDEAIEIGLVNEVKELRARILGADEMIGDTKKGNKIHYEGVIERLNTLQDKLTVLERLILILSRQLNLRPETIVNDLGNKFNSAEREYNQEFESLLKKKLEGTEITIKKEQEVKEWKNDKRVLKLNGKIK